MGADGCLIMFRKDEPEWFIQLLENNLTTPGSQIPQYVRDYSSSDIDCMIYSYQEAGLIVYYWDTERNPLIRDELSFDGVCEKDFEADFDKFNADNDFNFNFDSPASWFSDYIRYKCVFEEQVWT
jgi:hypothetical protein